MKVYEIKPDLKKHWLVPTNTEEFYREYRFNLERVEGTWNYTCPKTFYIKDPLRSENGDFLHLAASALVCRKTAESALGEIMHLCGEMLPGILDDTDEEIVILNPLLCYNCFDKKNSVYFAAGGEFISEVTKHVLFAERIGSSTLFRIAHLGGLYCLAGRDAEEDVEAFYPVYQKMGFTGLVFEEVWDSEA
jgi:hypothetical protein